MKDQTLNIFLRIWRIICWIFFGLGIILDNSFSLLLIFLGIGLFYVSTTDLPIEWNEKLLKKRHQKQPFLRK